MDIQAASSTEILALHVRPVFADVDRSDAASPMEDVDEQPMQHSKKKRSGCVPQAALRNARPPTCINLRKPCAEKQFFD